VVNGILIWVWRKTYLMKPDCGWGHRNPLRILPKSSRIVFLNELLKQRGVGWLKELLSRVPLP